MLFNKTTAVVACTAALAAFASSAMAQTPPAAAAAPAQPQLRTGPALPGICVYSDAVLSELSVTAKGVGTRLGALAKETQADLDRKEAALTKEINDFRARASTLPLEQAEQQDNALKLRQQQLEREAQIRSRELMATREKQSEVVQRVAVPLIMQVAQSRNCSILLASGVLFSHPAMDITPDVAKALDAQLKPFSFNRENLMQRPAAAAAPAAARPAAATPPKK